MVVKSGSVKAYRSYSPRRASSLPHLEPLEDRQLLATCHVVRLGDFGAGADLGGGHSRGDLRYCINKVNDEPGPDTILLQVNGTINLTGALPDLASDMEIVGPGAELLTIRRDTGGDYRPVTVASGSVTVSGVTITNGNANVGGGIYNQGTLILDDVAVTQNLSWAGQGGGIYNTGVLTATSSSVSSNTSTSCGGGVYNTEFGHITFDLGLISSNLSEPAAGGNSYGGGICNAGTMEVSFTIVGQNQARVTSNQSTAYGGGFYTTGTLSVFKSTINDNDAYAVGTGGLYAYGGGVYSPSGNGTTIESSTIVGNSAYAQAQGLSAAGGGGIRNGAQLTILNSTVYNNLVDARSTGSSQAYVSADGGGIVSGGQLTILNSTVSNNQAKATTSGYKATASGGGLNSAGVTTIRHSTIAGNAATTSGNSIRSSLGGGIWGGIASLQDTIVAGNKLIGCGTCQGPDLYGPLTSSGYNLFGNSDGGSGYAPTDILNVDPTLGVLADNGGPTLTQALLPGSPAIDAGDPNPVEPPDWDQRGPGFPRIVNDRIDIGAFEVQATGAPGIPDLLDLAVAAATSVLAEPSRFQVLAGNASRQAPLRVVVNEDTNTQSKREAELRASAFPSGAWERGEVARRLIVSAATPTDDMAPSLHGFPTDLLA